MSVRGFLPEAIATEIAAFTRARKLWIAAEAAELQRQRSQDLSRSDGTMPAGREIAVDPVSGHLGDARLASLECHNKGRESDIEGLNPSDQVVVFNHGDRLSQVFKTLRHLLDSGKAKIAKL